MHLICCYVKQFRNIVEQEVCFTDDYIVRFRGGVLDISRPDVNDLRRTAMDYVFGSSPLKVMQSWFSL